MRRLAAGGSAGDVDYVEAHGTGTSLGDPIEVRALGRVLGAGRASDRPLKVGSVKTNIGHLESAAGVAGLIKLVLCLQAEQIPPHLHFHQPNPHIDWSELPVGYHERSRGSQTGKKRLAGVSSFGFSGTNAHVLVEEAPTVAEPAPRETSAPLDHLCAHRRALRVLSARYADALHPDASSFADVCHTAAVGRAHHPHRLAVVDESTAAVAAALAGCRRRGGRGYPRGGHCEPPEVAFLFTGQGAQYVGMGRSLYDSQPTFRPRSTL